MGLWLFSETRLKCNTVLGEGRVGDPRLGSSLGSPPLPHTRRLTPPCSGVMGPEAPGGPGFTSLVGAEALRKGPCRLFWWEENTTGLSVPVPVSLFLSTCLFPVFPNVTLLGLAFAVLESPRLHTGLPPALSSRPLASPATVSGSPP